MKSILKSLCLILSLLLALTASAQDNARRVTGKITDENGGPMIGVGVVVAGTLNGVLSDDKGNYSITVSPDQDLQFSFLGYKTETVQVGNRAVIDVKMSPDAQVLEGTVVTALGIKRDEKSLGYSAQKVGEDVFANSAGTDNWLSALSGQVAGLNIATSNSGPGGTTRVTLRGESTADFSNNTALFVIDGVPMFNTGTSSDSEGEGSAHAIDYGDGSADVNPDDIESVTVLKGPAATALYGSSAANGAIIITTKSANKLQSKVSVTFSSSLTMQTVNTSPDLQYEYGQGGRMDYYYYSNNVDSGKPGCNPVPEYSSQNSVESWGPKLDGTLYYQYYIFLPV